MPDMARRTDAPYHKDQFVYDPESDSYTCPHGQNIPFAGWKRNKRDNALLYRMEKQSAAVCRECPAFGVCTKSALHGRVLQIRPDDAALRQHRAWMTTREPSKPTGAGCPWSSRCSPSSRPEWEPSDSNCGAWTT